VFDKIIFLIGFLKKKEGEVKTMKKKETIIEELNYINPKYNSNNNYEKEIELSQVLITSNIRIIFQN
jgi:ribosomal protein L24